MTDDGIAQSTNDTERIECGKNLIDPKNCGDPDVGGDWVCADDNCQIMHSVSFPDSER
jgi:hypothetical protein